MAAEGPSPSVQIQNVIEGLGPLFSSSANIHTYTRIIGARCKTAIQIENDFGLTETAPTLDAVIEDIQFFSNNDPAVNTVLATIRAQGAAIEPETRLNIPSMLRSTWHLATTCHYTNARDLVIDNLKHNIATKGGCPAGISARLVLPYLYFLKSLIDSLSGVEQQPETLNDIDLAIAESLITAEKDENLQLSIALEASQHPSVTPAKYNDEVLLSTAIEASKKEFAVHQVNEALEYAAVITLSQQPPPLRFMLPQQRPAPIVAPFDLSILTEDEQMEHALVASTYGG